MRFLAVLALVAFLSVPQGRAQPRAVTLTGTVTDASGQALPGAHVYLSGTTRGTATDLQGRFRLESLEPGAHRLVASVLGYVPGAEDVLAQAGETRTVDFVLEETALELAGEDGVIVEARRDRRWQRRYGFLEKTLLGESDLAAEAEILNPEVLVFRGRMGTLVATASAPLVIENRALGYRLTYDLTAFEASHRHVRYDGDERFEELVPEDAAETARWAANRLRAYRGSLQHALRALVRGTLEAEGFSLIHRPDEGRFGTDRPFGPSGMRPRRISIRPDRVLEEGDAPGTYVLHFRGLLEIVYEREPESQAYLESDWFPADRVPRADPVQTSQIAVYDGPVTLDARGEPSDPFGITSMGYFAFERVGELLPVEYEPPPGTLASRD